MSLMYHGFRLTYKRRDLKKRRGYVIPATGKEDADGVDLWVKMPRDLRLIPVQVTQRGVRLYRKHQHPSPIMFEIFVEHAAQRVRAKRKRCKKLGIAFVLVRDYDGTLTSTTIAWGDIKALRYALARLPPIAEK